MVLSHRGMVEFIRYPPRNGRIAPNPPDRRSNHLDIPPYEWSKHGEYTPAERSNYQGSAPRKVVESAPPSLPARMKRGRRKSTPPRHMVK